MSESRTRVPRQVVKRDGTVVTFDENKIADAIFAAARAVGGHDYRLAQQLASGVTEFLSRTHTGERIFIEDIQDVVEKVLIEAGHARTAKEYILYREKRTELRKQILVREGSSASNGSVFVDMRSSERLMPWDKGRISSALVREQQVPADLAYDIASSVEAKIFSSCITRISTGLIRELVDNELFERGLTGLLTNSTMISFPTFNMEQYLKMGVDRREANPAGFNRTVSRDVLRQYALQNVFSPESSEAHGRGDIHLHHLGDVNRVIRHRHCGPVKGSRPELALADLAFRLAEVQPYFLFYPRIDYFNILFAPLMADLGEAALRQSFREFLHLLRQLHLAANARGAIELDLYGYIPPHIEPLGVAEVFTPLTDRADTSYKDYYNEAHQFARLFLEEAAACHVPHDMLKFNVHVTDFFGEDPTETVLLEQAFELSKEGMAVTFFFGNGAEDVDRRMEFLGGGDVELHRASINVARLFFDIPVLGEEQVIEHFKTIFACSLYSGIEKLDFLSSLMRKPGQILWDLGRRGRGDALFDILNSYITIRLSGVSEALLFCQSVDIDGDGVLEEFMTIAADIIDSKGEEYPFSVRLLTGEMDSASFRFAEADMERYPEKRHLFQVNREGRLHYEGDPEFYGDDPVPIAGGAIEQTRWWRFLPGQGRVLVVRGAQVDSLGKFTSLVDDVRQAGQVNAFMLRESEQHDQGS